MLDDAAEHPIVITAEDGIRDGGVGSLIADALLRRDGPSPKVRVLGTPTQFIPHAKPDQILADLGLDATGLADEARSLVAALRA
jgi:1-deoxy-D-xylulose-5-phosphate synthase